MARLLRDGVGCAGPVFIDQSPAVSGSRAPDLSRKLRRVVGGTDLYDGVRRQSE